jgi:hypothetical protein
MNSVETSRRECATDSFGVEVSDLMASSVAGGALAGAIATAAATGNPSFAWTNTKTNAQQFGNGGSIAIGWGTAVASGNNPMTNVSVFGEGNSVLAYTSTTNSSTTRNSYQNNLSVSTGFVVTVNYS